MAKQKATIIKTYQGTRKTAEGVTYDTLLIWYRDENGVKQCKYIDRPETEYFYLKDPELAKSNAMYIDEKHFERVTCRTDQLFRSISDKVGGTEFYNMARYSGKKDYERTRALSNFHLHPQIYNSDMDLSDRYIAKFNRETELDKSYELHKCFYDIEVDLMPDGFKKNRYGTYGHVGFPDEDTAPCPINIITFIDGKFRKSYTFILRYGKNPLVKKFEEESDEFFEYLRNKVQTEDNKTYDFEVSFHDTELELIKAFFDKVHEVDPDYMLAWNDCFDVKTLLNRTSKLLAIETGVKNKYEQAQSMYDYVCDLKYVNQKNEFGHDVQLPTFARYKRMDQGKKNTATAINIFTIFDGINWLNQLQYYKVNHSAGGKRDSYKLDAIGKHEVGKTKVKFKKGITIKNLAWMDFKLFVEYNIVDVILLDLIEDKSRDVDTLQQLAYVTNTRKEKVFSKSISLANFVNKYCRDNHTIMNNNMNKSYGDLTDIFNEYYSSIAPLQEPDKDMRRLLLKRDRFGALVSDPNLNENVGEELIPGFRSKHYFRNVCDQDLSSLYPSIIRTLNADTSTLVGKFVLKDDRIKNGLKDNWDYNGLFNLSNKDTDDEDDDDDDVVDNYVEEQVFETDDLVPTLIDSMISLDFTRIGEKFMFLPNCETMLDEIDTLYPVA